MTELDEVGEMFKRFERSPIYVKDEKNSDTLIRHFSYYQSRATTHTQEVVLRKYAKEKGIKIVKHKGISEKKGILREKLKRRYTQFKRRGKVYIQSRDSRTGRFTKR